MEVISSSRSFAALALTILSLSCNRTTSQISSLAPRSPSQTQTFRAQLSHCSPLVSLLNRAPSSTISTQCDQRNIYFLTPTHLYQVPLENPFSNSSSPLTLTRVEVFIQDIFQKGIISWEVSSDSSRVFFLTSEDRELYILSLNGGQNHQYLLSSHGPGSSPNLRFFGERLFIAPVYQGFRLATLVFNLSGSQIIDHCFGPYPINEDFSCPSTSNSL